MFAGLADCIKHQLFISIQPCHIAVHFILCRAQTKKLLLARIVLCHCALLLEPVHISTSVARPLLLLQPSKISGLSFNKFLYVAQESFRLRHEKSRVFVFLFF